MVVSHYVVSWIQVIGLIIGLDGFFFLSFSVFGKTSTPWFRAMLPATGVGLGVLLLSQTDPLLATTPWPPAVGWGMALFFVVWAYLAAAFGITFRLSKNDQPSEKLVTFSVVGGTALATVLYIVMLGIAIFQIVTGQPMGADWRSTGLLTGMLLVLWSLVSLDLLPRVFTENRLLKLGIVLSVFAILTQFIPPVLDLLNIAIK